MTRFLLSVPITCLLILLLSRRPEWPGETHAFVHIETSQKPVRLSFMPPLIDDWSHPSSPLPTQQRASAEDLLDAELIDPVKASNIKAPEELINLAHCPRSPNQFTGHIRLPNLLYNISMSPIAATKRETRTFWNPTIFALPYWAKSQYIIVNMVASHGEPYRRNVLCEANICHPESRKSNNPREMACTEEDLEVLGPNGGLRCVTSPVEVDVPPTPVESCDGNEQLLADIPGFHDPRLFYSGRGEPILMVVSQ
jgi:hypothetical protein